jgi:hypothetical protein
MRAMQRRPRDIGNVQEKQIRRPHWRLAEDSLVDIGSFS